MKIGNLSIEKQQRRAFEFLTKNANVNPNDVTIPARLVQELPYVSTNSNYLFDFSSNAPKADATHNNMLLPENNFAAIYGYQLLIGYGANAFSRIYQSDGFTSPNDMAIYNSIFSIKMESSVLVNFISGQSFREVSGNGFDRYDEMGMVLANPLRILSGRLGIFQVNLNMIQPLTAGFPQTSNLWLSMRLHVAMGQASGTK